MGSMIFYGVVHPELINRNISMLKPNTWQLPLLSAQSEV